MARILLTGGTGFVNSFLAAALLQSGEELYFLARSNEKSTAADRIQRALRLSAHTDIDITGDQVIEADLTKPNLGISDADLSRLKAIGFDEIIHGAGSVNFSQHHSASTMAANHAGTERMLALAGWLNTSCFHYIGTAYASQNTSVYDHIAGSTQLACAAFNNQYEYSKNLAASVVRKWASGNDKRAIIYEPSIIAGHSVTGCAFNFSAFYNCLYVYRFLQHNRLQAGHIHSNQVMVSLPGHPEAKINLISIDYFIQLFLQIRNKEKSGTYQIINDRPPQYLELQQMCLQHYGLENITINGSREARVEVNGKTDPGLSAYLTRRYRAYLPYISKTYDFNAKELRLLLGSSYQPHEEITALHIGRFAAYADENNFQLTP